MMGADFAQAPWPPFWRLLASIESMKRGVYLW
jgi:hypothetical protein